MRRGIEYFGRLGDGGGSAMRDRRFIVTPFG
jgi:hypothetical protein